MTQGTYHPLLPPPFVWNPTGSISIVKLRTDSAHGPYLVDIDTNPSTTTYGAPSGITRIEPPAEWNFVPLSIQDVSVPKSAFMYQVGDKWPGEYLFLSGVGPAEWTWIDPIKCQPLFICDPIHILRPRPIEVAVVDLNPNTVTGITMINGKPVPVLGPNLTYRQFIKRIPIGSGGQFPSDQGLSFRVFQQGRDMNAYIYAVNPAQNFSAIIDFNAMDTLKDAVGEPILVPTGDRPTDVKVQTVETAPGIFKTYAYIVNAADDTVTVLDATTNSITSTLDLDGCQVKDHYPTAFDTRSSGDTGYSCDFHGDSLTVIDLQASSLLPGIGCDIATGQAPIRIAVQPVVTLTDAGGPIEHTITFADPVADFSEPAKQSILISDFQHIQDLQTTQASPQAVISNLENFQKNAAKWIKTESVKAKVKEAVDLYQLIYKADQ